MSNTPYSNYHSAERTKKKPKTLAKESANIDIDNSMNSNNLLIDFLAECLKEAIEENAN